MSQTCQLPDISTRRDPAAPVLCPNSAFMVKRSGKRRRTSCRSACKRSNRRHPTQTPRRKMVQPSRPIPVPVAAAVWLIIETNAVPLTLPRKRFHVRLQLRIHQSTTQHNRRRYRACRLRATPQPNFPRSRLTRSPSAPRYNFKRQFGLEFNNYFRSALTLRRLRSHA
jgi:hypothetical protein